MLKCTIKNSKYKTKCNGELRKCSKLCGYKNKTGLLPYDSFDKRTKDKVKNYLKDRDGKMCKICGQKEVEPLGDLLQIEHIFPKNKEFLNGENERFLESCLLNFVLVCPKCNNRKLDTPITQRDYDIIFDYNIENDCKTYIDGSGIFFDKDVISILMYYNLKDEYILALEYSLLSHLSGDGITRYIKKETNKYIKNTLEMRKNEILY